MLHSNSRSSLASRFCSLSVLSYSCSDFVSWFHKQIADNIVAVEAPPVARGNDIGMELWLSDDREVQDAVLDNGDVEAHRFVYGYELDLIEAREVSTHVPRPELDGEDHPQSPPEFAELIVEWQSDGTPIARVAGPPLLPSIDWNQSRRQFRELMALSMGDAQAATWVKRAFSEAKTCELAANWRYSALAKFLRAMVTRQSNFFRQGHLHGLKAACRLTREMLATDLNWSASVVGRAAKGKTLVTPWNETVPVEKLLDGGRSQEATAIVEGLTLILRDEDVRSPRSDDFLAATLFERFRFQLARRTVAKIRRDSGIPSAHARRRGGASPHQRSVA